MPWRCRRSPRSEAGLGDTRAPDSLNSTPQTTSQRKRLTRPPGSNNAREQSGRNMAHAQALKRHSQVVLDRFKADEAKRESAEAAGSRSFSGQGSPEIDIRPWVLTDGGRVESLRECGRGASTGRGSAFKGTRRIGQTCTMPPSAQTFDALAGGGALTSGQSHFEGSFWLPRQQGRTRLRRVFTVYI
jgi:hypothetical protein